MCDGVRRGAGSWRTPRCRLARQAGSLGTVVGDALEVVENGQSDALDANEWMRGEEIFAGSKEMWKLLQAKPKDVSRRPLVK